MKPRGPARVERRLAAILAADVAGYSRLIEADEEGTLGRLKALRHVILPELSPYIIAAARSGLAITWKIVLVVELLGRSNGVGFQIYLAFQLFDVTTILAYTVAFIAVIQLIELMLLRPLDRRVHAWRR